MRKVPFNLEKAKSGAKLVTRDGKSARIVCFDYRNEKSSIIALIDEGEYERAITFYDNGKMYDNRDFAYDLFILEGSTYRPYANAEEVLKAWTNGKEKRK